jgi:TolB protein
MKIFKKAFWLIATFTLFASTGFSEDYYQIDKPGIKKFGITVQTETVSSKNKIFIKRLEKMLEQSLLFTNVEKQDADFIFNMKASVEEQTILFSLEGAKSKIVNKQTFGINLTSTEDDYLSFRTAQVANKVIQELFKIKGSIGSTIVYSRTEDNRKMLYMNQVAINSKPVRITYNQYSNSNVSWNPDKTKIVYTAHTIKGSQIMTQQVVPLLLETFVVFKDLGKASGPYWGTDNNVYMTLHVTNRNSDIYQFGFKGSDPAELSEIKRLTSNSGIETEGQLSPDGTQLAYVSDKTGSPQIYLLDINANKSTRLTKSGGYNVTPAWAPNGKSIAFRGIRNKISAIYRIDLSSNKERQITPNSIDAEEPTWSPDNSLIAFVGKYGDSASKIYFALASGAKEINRLTESDDNIIESAPSWGPDLR